MFLLLPLKLPDFLSWIFAHLFFSLFVKLSFTAYFYYLLHGKIYTDNMNLNISCLMSIFQQCHKTYLPRSLGY